MPPTVALMGEAPEWARNARQRLIDTLRSWRRPLAWVELIGAACLLVGAVLGLILEDEPVGTLLAALILLIDGWVVVADEYDDD